MATWSELSLSRAREARRVDAEYYAPAFLELEAAVRQSGWPIEPFGDLMHGGARAVYENTRVYDEPGSDRERVHFIQASNVAATLPVVAMEGVGWVSRDDWRRYPQGRTRPGEILIEVKGRAEKVAVVSEDVPADTLVSGSLYKCLARADRIDPLFLVAYLGSRYGRGLRARTLANTLIGFVSRDDLHELPVPVVREAIQREASAAIKDALTAERRSRAMLTQAEATVVAALPELEPPRASLTSVAHYDEVGEAGRLDAEFFQPDKRKAIDALAAIPGGPLASQFESIREMMSPAREPRGSWVRNFDLADALFPVLNGEKQPVRVEEIGSTKKRLRDGDVVISRLRSYLRQVAVVAVGADAVGSSEFIVLRRLSDESISAETLVAYLRAPYVQRILMWSQDGSAHPRFDVKHLEAIRLPEVLRAVDNDVKKAVREGIALRSRAIEKHAEATGLVEDAIQEGPRRGCA